MLQTASKGRSNCPISPRHMELLPEVRSCIGSYSMELNGNPTATMVIQCITELVGANVRQQAEQQIPEGIRTDTGCN